MWKFIKKTKDVHFLLQIQYILKYINLYGTYNVKVKSKDKMQIFEPNSTCLKIFQPILSVQNLLIWLLIQSTMGTSFAIK